MGLEGEKGLPFGVGEGFAFSSEEELQEDTDGVGEDVGVEFGEYFALVPVMVLPG